MGPFWACRPPKQSITPPVGGPAGGGGEVGGMGRNARWPEGLPPGLGKM